jgi:predicted metallo-beta-lactamase superfamily hydrolase
MTIEIISTESLGVRGMCCVVKTNKRRIVIDPGIALGYMRNGLLPHPCQIAIGQKVRLNIINVLKSATDVIFSHFHGDHVPLLNANPFQLSFYQLPAHFKDLHCWSQSYKDLPAKIQVRALELAKLFGPNMKIAEGYFDEFLQFSQAVPHGTANSKSGNVMMSRINLGNIVFVHASDIQLLDAVTVQKILTWEPDVVFASGPPLYLNSLDKTLLKQARDNALHLARNVDTLILDHHLLRNEQGVRWLDNLRKASKGKVCCAADFMGKPRLLLEAKRSYLYQKLPIMENWHQDYSQGNIDIEAYFGDHCLKLPLFIG